jgi:hypothetical protein
MSQDPNCGVNLTTSEIVFTPLHTKYMAASSATEADHCEHFSEEKSQHYSNIHHPKTKQKYQNHCLSFVLILFDIKMINAEESGMR